MSVTIPAPKTTATPVISFKVIDVTPDIASAWLENNDNNRHLRPSRVKQYTNDMLTGNWRLTGETVKFDRFGHLLDGQHRLTAVVESGATVPMAVVGGVEPEARQFMDTGASRTASDALRMRGTSGSYAPILAGAAKIGIHLESNTHVNSRVSHAQVFDYIERNDWLVTTSSSCTSLIQKIDMPPSVIAYAKFRTDVVDFEASEEFWNKLANMNDLAADDPILRFANRLRMVKRNGDSHERKVLIGATFRVWNAWRAGVTMQRIQFPSLEAELPTLR